MNPFLTIFAVVLICALTIVSVNIIYSRRHTAKILLDKKEQQEKVEESERKLAFIKRALGFDPYSYTKVSQLFNKLSEKYNTDIRHYFVYKYINDNTIPGGQSVADALPVETIYLILTSISHRQGLIFKYH